MEVGVKIETGKVILLVTKGKDKILAEAAKYKKGFITTGVILGRLTLLGTGALRLIQRKRQLKS